MSLESMLSQGAQRFGDLVMDIIEGIGQKLTGLGAAAGAAMASMRGDSSPSLGRSSDPMDRSMDLRPSNSPAVALKPEKEIVVVEKEVERPITMTLRPEHALAVQAMARDDSQLYAADNNISMTSLGEFVAPPTPSVGIRKSQGMAMA